MPRKRKFGRQMVAFKDYGSHSKNIEYVGTREAGTEWAGEEDAILMYRVDGEEVEVVIRHPDHARREGLDPIYVVWGGAVDFEGNRRDFKSRYPELAKEAL